MSLDVILRAVARLVLPHVCEALTRGGKRRSSLFKSLTWSLFLHLLPLTPSMSQSSQSSQVSTPADLAARLRYKTDRDAALAYRGSLAAASDAASANEWVRGFGAAVVRSAFSSSFQLV